MPLSVRSVAKNRATSILIVAWIGSSQSSLKLVLRDHPSDVVLSVMERQQSPFFSRPARISTHTVMIDAICSSKLLEARPCNSIGT